MWEAGDLARNKGLHIHLLGCGVGHKIATTTYLQCWLRKLDDVSPHLKITMDTAIATIAAGKVCQYGRRLIYPNHRKFVDVDYVQINNIYGKLLNEMDMRGEEFFEALEKSHIPFEHSGDVFRYDKAPGGIRFPLTEILVERNPTKNDLRKYGLDSWTNALLSLDNYHWEVEKARVVNEWAERYRATKVAPAEAGTFRQILEIDAVLDD